MNKHQEHIINVAIKLSDTKRHIDCIDYITEKLNAEDFPPEIIVSDCPVTT
jgi:hypothetical protein